MIIETFFGFGIDTSEICTPDVGKKSLPVRLKNNQWCENGSMLPILALLVHEAGCYWSLVYWYTSDLSKCRDVTAGSIHQYGTIS